MRSREENADLLQRKSGYSTLKGVGVTPLLSPLHSKRLECLLRPSDLFLFLHAVFQFTLTSSRRVLHQ